MVSASHIRRALHNTSPTGSTAHHGASRVQGKRRLMGTASAMSLPSEEQPIIGIQIFDIFDAPSRLGESSRLLARASSSRASSARSERTMSTTSDHSSAIRYVKPLPAPVLYDGPARPGHLAHGGLRARRAHSHAFSGAASHEKQLSSSLPPPVIFDGPSRLRPYCRETSQEQAVRWTHSCLLSM